MSCRVLKGVRPVLATAVAGRRPPAPRVAIIGSGPAGFYTALRLMKRLPGTRVDMYEGLSVPFGLSRFGVAPDHPEVKECEKAFSTLGESPNFTFIGNTSIGDSSIGKTFIGPSHPDTPALTIPLPTLLRNYHSIIFAYGASHDKPLDVPNENRLTGIYSAREFVAWYNGDPRFSHLTRIARHLACAEEVTIIGQGNVALDVARMLLTPVDILRKTDMADYALDALAGSHVKRVHVVGRRGPMQVKFTRKELRELVEMEPSLGFHSQYFGADLLPSDATKIVDRPQKRLVATLRTLQQKGETLDSGASKSWSLDFLLKPIMFYPNTNRTGVGGTIFEKRVLVSADAKDSQVQPLKDEGGVVQRTRIPSQLIFKSIGYQAVPLPGFSEANIGFENGTIVNDGRGRVGSVKPTKDGLQTIIPGLYCAGWVKTGPTGKISHTMSDSFSTAETLAEDWKAGVGFLGDQDPDALRNGWDALRTEVGDGASDTVVWEAWQRIDKVEQSRGAETGRPRQKITTAKGLLEASRAPDTPSEEGPTKTPTSTQE